MVFKNIFTSLLLLSFLNSGRGQTADELISKYIQHIGGVQKWSTIKTMVISGNYNYGGMVFPFKSFSKAPNLYKYIVTSNGKSFEQAFDGVEGWKIDGFKNETKKTILTGKSASAMANETDVDIESPLVNYRLKGYTAIVEGQDTVGHQQCFKIKFITKNGDTGRYFFSAANFELLKKQSISKNEELDSSVVDIFYSDYREINGIRIAYNTVCKVGDQTILTITFDNVIFNEPLSDDEFKP